MLSFDNLQTGHKYFLRNYGEESSFTIMDILMNGDCLAKHLETLELFHLSDLVQFGKGADYELREI